MELHELRVFLSVARERSFSRAAVKLGRTQPAISQAVRRLEEHVGELLFDRASKNGTLTEAGQRLVDHAARVLRTVDDAEAAVRAVGTARSQRLLIGADESTISALLGVITEFREQCPRSTVSVRHLEPDRIEDGVVKTDLDFGLLKGHPKDGSLSTVKIAEDALVLIAPVAHCIATEPDVSLENVRSYPLIMLCDEWEPCLRASVVLPSVQAIMAAVRLGLGLGLVPSSSIRSETPNALTVLRFSEPRTRAVHLIHRSNVSCSEDAAAFLVIAEGAFGGAGINPTPVGNM
jgi:DNA-binding transcriptional LysR family regulator